MKLKVIVVLTLLVSVVMSCDSETQLPGENIESQPTVIEAVVENETELLNENEVEEETNIYALDFEKYKTAIIDKDTSLVAKYNNTDDIDVEQLLMFFNDELFLNDLKNAKYSDLKSIEKDGEQLLEFSSHQVYSEDGDNEFESAIFLYFMESKTKLLLHSYLVAG